MAGPVLEDGTSAERQVAVMPFKVPGQIACPLDEAPAAGILHRDPKPANILVTAKGAAKLLAFDLAKLTGDAATTETISIVAGAVARQPSECRLFRQACAWYAPR